MLDIDIHEVGAGIKMIIPDVLANLGACKSSTRRTHQISEQRKFAGGQLDGFLAAFHLAGQQIDGDVSVLEKIYLLAGSAANERVQSGEQVPRCKTAW